MERYSGSTLSGKFHAFICRLFYFLICLFVQYQKTFPMQSIILQKLTRKEIEALKEKAKTLPKRTCHGVPPPRIARMTRESIEKHKYMEKGVDSIINEENSKL